jgi:hypothetical protein
VPPLPTPSRIRVAYRSFDWVKLGQRYGVGGDRVSRNSGCAGRVEPPDVRTCARTWLANRRDRCIGLRYAAPARLWPIPAIAQHAAVALPHCRASLLADISPATATFRRPQPSASPSTAKTQIALYKTTVPILYRAFQANGAAITQPSSLFETERSGRAPTLNLHRPTPLPAQTDLATTERIAPR